MEIVNMIGSKIRHDEGLGVWKIWKMLEQQTNGDSRDCKVQLNWRYNYSGEL